MTTARVARVLALAVLCLAGRACAGVSVALTPAYQILAPGSDFTVNVDVTVAGSSFNGYELVIEYDPSVLTLLPTTPTALQQGCLMTGGCSSACGSTFHNFTAAGDSLVVTDVLLCNQAALTGPGQIYQLRFRSVLTPQTTQIRLRRASFYNAGIAVTPVNATRTSIGIGVGLGVNPGATNVPHAVRAEPNPSFGGVRIVTEDAAAGLAEADIVDLLGRVLRHLGPAPLGANASLAWDGRDERGARVPPGLYLVRVVRAQRVQTTRVVLLH